MKFSFKEDVKRIIIIILASFIMAITIKSFVRTGDLFPGGVTGLTLLIQRVAEVFFKISIPYTPVNLTLNAFPVYIGFRYIGKKFTLYSCLVIVLTGIFTDIIPGIIITYDTLLISIFGGIITGFVVSLCLMMNATTGGTDFIAIYLSDKKGMDSFNIVLYVNIVIISLAGLLFGWDKALYSIIFQFVSTQILHELYKKYQKQTLLIVTNRPNAVCKLISEASHHGATILRGEGSYEHRERFVVYSVVSSAESKKIIHAIKKIDASAFINSLNTNEISGRFYLKPNE
ncbi:MAG: YitT family protein [Lachnospiraceae bacterium]|nr:YitT family protein [Lachnospiraceae bacterium]